MIFAVHQPNFCPWLGFFLKLHSVDVFVILDDVQMPLGRSFVSRTKIRGGQAGTWLSLSTSGPSGLKIADVPLAPQSHGFRERNLNLLRDRYSRCEHFSRVFPVIEREYARGSERLIELNLGLIAGFNDLLGISKPLVLSSTLRTTGAGDLRIAEIGVALGASGYLSGVGGSAYQQEQTYIDAGIQLVTLEVPRQIARLENVGFSLIDHLMSSGPQNVRQILDTLRVQL